MINIPSPIKDLRIDLENGLIDLSDFFGKICERAKSEIDTSRVSIWYFDDSQYVLECVCLVDESGTYFFPGIMLAQEEFPEYFNYIKNNQIVVSIDAYKHPATKCFASNYLSENRICSMLDHSINFNNKIIGVICCENQWQYKFWSRKNELFLKGLASTLGDMMINPIEEKELV